ncbi:MAG TPA: hypothetical protein VJR29_12210, partial [bacterium]|nr:hypothetical protein [bacterium]
RFSKPAVKDEAAKPAADAKPATSSSERSFARGAMALLGKIPGFGPRKSAPKADPKPAPKPDSKPAPTQPEAQPVPPPNAPKSEGVRPTLPDGLKFPPAQVGMGEKNAPLSNREIRQSANELMGEYAGLTHEGVGRERNEDGIGMAYTNERDLVLVAVDGMGGHAGGKEAANLTLTTVTEAVQVNGDLSAAMHKANDAVKSQLHPTAPKGREPGACIGAVKIRRPDTLNGPHTLEANWGGDVKIYVLRKGSDGKRRWIYQNAEDNLARMAVEFDINQGKTPKEDRDLAIITHERASNIFNPVGSPKSFGPHSTNEGYVPDASGYPVPAKGIDRLPLETGDVVLVLPDGTSKNLKDPQVLIDLIEGKEGADEIIKTIDAWVGQRMKKANEVDETYEKGTYPRDRRQGVFVDGVQRFVDSNGNVFEAPQGGKAIDHLEADNWSGVAYVHNPKAESKPKADSDPGIQPPSNNSRTDDDTTQIFRKPE